MVYGAYEARRALLSPLRKTAARGSATFEVLQDSGAPLPFLNVGRAMLGTMSTLELTHTRPDFRIEVTDRDGSEVLVREEPVLSTPFATLQRFSTEVTGSLPRVLVVPGLAGHFATLVRGTVKALLADHEVYVADWHNARDVPAAQGPFGLDEYIQHIIDFLDEIGPDTHVVAVCQPCVAVLAAAAIMAEDAHPAQPKSVVLIAGPVDARVNPGRVNEFATKYSPATLERLAITTVPWPHEGAGRRVYPGFYQVMGFMGMSPRRHLSAFGSLFVDIAKSREAEAARTREFYEEYFAVLDMAAEFYLDTTKVVFQEHHLARGEMEWKGRKVDPGAITSALLTVEAENDEFCPPGQTQAAHDLCPNIPAARKRHHLQNGVGHYGVFTGNRFENEIYPQIQAFFASS